MRFHNLHGATKRLPILSLMILGLLLIITATITLLELVAGLPTSSYSAADPDSKQEKQVREFVEAFNAHDSKRMIECAHENIQWLSVDREKILVETEGVKALRESMDNYFRGCPSCRSTLEWVKRAGSRVTTMERAEWIGKSGPKSQKSLAVYEFHDGKIVRVYYFPAEVSTKSN